MRADKHTPPARYPLPVLPSESFRPLRDHELGMADAIQLRTTEDQFRKLGIVAFNEGASVMDEIRGAVEPFLRMYFDRSDYYEIPLFDELPKDAKTIRFTGRLGMAQLWRLSKLARIGSTGSANRLNSIVYSANELYIQRRLEDDATFGAYARRVQELDRLTPPAALLEDQVSNMGNE